jgi:alpha-tubulin suppressor-like RCC1 family protein
MAIFEIVGGHRRSARGSTGLVLTLAFFACVLALTDAVARDRATAVVAGDQHTCGLTDTGGVKCWGWNVYGQLGDGTWTRKRVRPVDVSGLTSGVAAIAAGGDHACALTTAGSVKCWGANGEGQLGDGKTTYGNTPVDVRGLTSGVAAIAAGLYHTCAVTVGGGVKCWGYNGYGQLGDGTTKDRLTPVDVSGLTSGVAAIAAGGGLYLEGGHTCAVTVDGGVKCWGYNRYGQLGDGTTKDRLTPVDVTAGLSNGVAAIAMGYYHTCAVTASGGLKCWGLNDNGQLGDGTIRKHRTPTDVSGLAIGVAAVAAGGYHTCAVTAAGGAKCWGNNYDGELGDGTTTTRLTSVDVSELASGVAAVAAGAYHTCALIAAGGVKCWGWNDNGQLGDGSRKERLTPVRVSGF